MEFKRCEVNPIIPRTKGTFYSEFVANPDVLFFSGRYHYFRGQAEDGHDQIGVAYSNPNAFDGIHWDMYADNPIIRVGRNVSDFNSNHVLDPAAVEFGGEVYLYYTAHSQDRNIAPSIGLMISEDGTHFEGILVDPVVNGVAPEVVLHDDKIYILYQRLASGGYWEIHCCWSDDGVHYPRDRERIVFGPSGKEGAFDRFSLATVRIWQEGGWFYMAYAGCDKFTDYPCAIGLARSLDLFEWERYPDNPVLPRGAPGTWDEGALWFPTICKVRGTHYLWYEGCGTGLGLRTPEAREASRKSREENYGGYGKTAFSQIGLATYPGEIPIW